MSKYTKVISRFDGIKEKCNEIHTDAIMRGVLSKDQRSIFHSIEGLAGALLQICEELEEADKTEAPHERL
jgi:hypothetical protein